MLRNMLPVGSVTEVDLSTPVLSLEGKVVPSSAVPLRRGSCFSCGQQGPWGDPMFADGRIFPFSVAGLVGDMRNGQYWASRIRGDAQNYTPGKVGWSGWEGQPPGSSEIVVQLTPGGGGGGGERVLGGHQPAWQQPVGCVRESRWTPNVQGFPALGSHSPADDGRRERPVPDDSGDVSANDISKVSTSPLEMGRSHVVPHGSKVCVPQRGMWPAGAVRPSLQKPLVGVLDVRKNAAARPLSAGAAEFSPALGPHTRVTAGTVDLSSRTGTIAPVDVAEISVPAVAGVRFSAVAEVHSSANEVDEDTSVVRASEQRSEGSAVPRTAPGMVNEPMAGILVPEPLDHSVLVIDLDGRPMEGISVLEPLEHSVLDVDLDSGHMEGKSGLGSLEHSVLDVNLEIDLWRVN